MDSRLLAVAHRRALVAGGSGQRYAVVGPYLSYGELARLVASITGRPRWIVAVARSARAAGRAGGRVGSARVARRWWPDVSPQLAAGRVSAVASQRRAGECMPSGSSIPRRETIASCFAHEPIGFGAGITGSLRLRVVGDIHRHG